MNLIEEYKGLAAVCTATDFSDSGKVAKLKEYAERMCDIAEKIGYEDTMETIGDFVKLLNETNSKTNLWAAVHLLKRMPADKRTEKKALRIVNGAIEQSGDGHKALINWMAENV